METETQPQIYYAPDYLRAQADKQLHVIADLVEHLIRKGTEQKLRIQELEEALKVKEATK